MPVAAWIVIAVVLAIWAFVVLSSLAKWLFGFLERW
jgi:hypothetical protein